MTRFSVLRGLLTSLQPARCCNCRTERDQALIELARLKHKHGERP